MILYPLPKAPVMICYWGDEDGLGSTVNLFFDQTANENLPQGVMFTLCTKMTLMFERVCERHAKFVRA